MKLPSTVQVAKFPPCGDGLKALKSFKSQELIAAGRFDICTLNDGEALEKYCSYCLSESPKMKCTFCQMVRYCSDACTKNDSKLHELECLLATRLKPFSKLPTRSQRLLLRFIKSDLKSDVNCAIESIDKGISEYLMVGIAIIKKYMPDLKDDPKELMMKLWQLRCSCFEIEDIGIGYSDSLKKINHSCDPNLIAEFSKDSVSLYTLKYIGPGEQLTISYVDDPEMLSKYYNFKCKCQKCTRT